LIVIRLISHLLVLSSGTNTSRMTHNTVVNVGISITNAITFHESHSEEDREDDAEDYENGV